MRNGKELDRLQRIAAVYHSERLAGANEQYHVYLRDTLIPEDGGRSALELGCGKGLWTRALGDRYDAVDVIDGSRELLDEVAANYGDRRAKLTTHAGLVEDFEPAPGEVWQHVYVTFLLEHVVDPVAALEHIKRFLDKDGRLFIAVPNADSVHRVVAVRMGLIETTDQLSDNDRRVGHRRVYTPQLLRSQLASSGYTILQEHPIGLKPVTLKQMETWPEEMVWAFCASGDLCPANSAYIAVEAALP